MNHTFKAPLAQLTRLAQPLVRYWRASVWRQGWDLWLTHLRACLPKHWQHRLLGYQPEVLCPWPLIGPQPVLVAGARLVLLLPRSAVLVQHLELPLASARNLQTVVEYELDRLTPFEASQLYFVARREGRNGRFIRVRLVAILRDHLDALLKECATQGLHPSAVDIQDDANTRLHIDLLPASLRVIQQASGQGVKRFLLWLCAGLLISAMLLLLNQRHAVLAQMQTTVLAQRDEVAQLQKVRQQLANTRDAADYLIRRKAAQPPLAALLAELTGCLPADTWVEQLEINHGADISFSGQSAKASALIGRIKDCHSLKDARFEGVIQPDPHTGKDHFSIRAHIIQEAGHAPSAD